MADLIVAKRLGMNREDRQVDGLIGMLRRIANDLETGKAVESDFNIKIEEGNNLDAIDLTLTTYHLKATKEGKLCSTNKRTGNDANKV